MSEPVDRLTAALADRYRIERILGSGGMATVYAATDLKQNRPVALKLLKPELAASIGHERFLREIRITAQLNHARIVPVLDSGEADGLLYYVMPLIEGESLRQRLVRDGQLPVEEAVEHAAGVAHALAYAHDHGIVHRDIKPENILISGGEAMVADFGIARAVTEAAGSRLTETGLAVGTPAYMSPEQAAGERNVDARSDLYALGCVLYEMLAGEPPFTGPTLHAITARKLSESVPSLQAVRDTVTPSLEAVVNRALARVPADRYTTAQQFVQALQQSRTPVPGVPIVVQSTASKAAWGNKVPWVIAAASILVAVAGLLAGSRSTTTVPPHFSFEIRLAPGDSIPQGRTLRFTISEDGRRVAFVAQPAGDSVPRIFVRDLDTFGARAVVGTENGEAPFFSPDGEWLGFYDRVNRRLLKVPVKGGTPFVICRAEVGWGASWGSDGFIVYDLATLAPLHRVAAAGGTPELISYGREGGDNTFYDMSPQVLPGGKAVLFTATGGATRVNNVGVVSLATRIRKILVKDALHARFVPPNHLLYAHDQQLWSVGFDPERLAVVGAPVAVRDSVQGGTFEVSGTGTLVYEAAIPGIRVEQSGPITGRGGPLVWIDRAGQVETVPMPRGQWFGPRLSPDERSVVFIGPGNEANPVAGIWVLDFERKTTQRLTDPALSSYWPVWTRDGRQIVFNVVALGEAGVQLKVMRADGSRPSELLLKSDLFLQAYSTLPDGTLAFMRDPDPKTGFDILTLSLSGDRKPKPLLTTPANEQFPAFSPDGHWLAYASDESGRAEIYVRRYPEMDRLERVSTDGGMYPAWSLDGRELYFVEGEQRMMVAPFRDGPGPVRLLLVPRQPIDFVSARTFGRSYDVSRTGRSIAPLQLRRPPISALQIVTGWGATIGQPGAK